MTDASDAFSSDLPTLPAEATEDPLFVGARMTRLSAAEGGVEAIDEEGFAARYEFGEVIARGGMGEVVSCLDRTLRREVALKRMKVRGMRARGPLRRFVREAQITAQLAHPSIVPVYELGLDGDEPYFTMKRVVGETLEEHINALKDGEAETSIPKRVQLMIQVCQAVSFAHSQGVLHRDIKPANIMLGPFGEVLVMDWGLARLGGVEERFESEEAEREKPASSSSSSISAETLEPELRTRAGQALGTPMYMSPEQARGELSALDEGTDIYSLGAVLLSFLTLRAPVPAVGARMVIGRVKRGQVDFVRPDETHVPPELAAIVRKAMALSRSDRYASVSDLIRDLEAALSFGAVSAYQDDLWRTLARLARRHRTSMWALIAGVVALGFGVAAAFVWANSQREAEALALLDEGQISLSSGRPAEAQELFARVLGLKPDSSRARAGLQQAVRHIDVLREREAAAEALVELEEAEAAARAARDEGRQRWYEAQSEALSRARQLQRLEDWRGPGHSAVARLSRELAHALAEDESFVMAELMLREAEGSRGEPQEAIAAERAFIERRRKREEREILFAARAVLLEFDGRIELAEEHVDAAVQRIVARPHPRLAQLLFEVFNDAPWTAAGRALQGGGTVQEIAIRALCALDTEGVTFPQDRWSFPHFRECAETWPGLAAPLEALKEDLWGEREVAELTIEDFALITFFHGLCHAARTFNRNWPATKALEALLALIERGGKPYAGLILSELAWIMDRGSSSWEMIEKALASLPRPEGEWPADPVQQRARARWHILAGEPAAALAGLEATPDATLEKAVASLTLGRFAEAEALSEQLIARPDRCSIGLTLRAEARLGLGQLEAAAIDARRGAGRDLKPWRFALIGDIALAQGDEEGALRAYERGLSPNSRLRSLRRRRAELCERLGDTTKALADWTQLHDLDPDESLPLARRGALWLKVGERSLAQEDLLGALEREPHNEAIILDLARVAIDLITVEHGHFQQAIASAYERLAPLLPGSEDPELWEAAASLSRKLCWPANDGFEQSYWRRALAQVRRAIELGGGERCRELEAQLLLRLGQHGEARPRLEALGERAEAARAAVLHGDLSGLEVLTRLCAERPDSAALAQTWVEASIATGRAEARLPQLEAQLAAATPEARATWLTGRALLLSRLGRDGGLEDALEAARLAPGDPFVCAHAASALARAKRFAEAVPLALDAMFRSEDPAIRARGELVLLFSDFPENQLWPQ